MDVIAKIRNSGKRCQIHVTREGAFRVRNELGGKASCCNPMSPAEAEAFIEEFQ